MSETQEYFIDILNLVPVNFFCYIQSPHEEILEVLKYMSPAKEGGFIVVELSLENRNVLVQATISKHIEQFIHRIEIKFGGKLIFEGYDGIEYGGISKQINIPQEFLEKHVNGSMCFISKDW